MSDHYKAQLQEHGHRTQNGRWWFSTPAHTHSEENALVIVEACSTLDIPITDLITAVGWVKLIKRVVALEERLEHYRLYGFSRSAEDG